MPKQPEIRDVEEPVVKWAEEHGIGCRKLEWVGRRGAPDRFFVKDDTIVVIEFKRPGGKLSPIQTIEHVWFAEHGHAVPVFDDVGAAIKFLRHKFGIEE